MEGAHIFVYVCAFVFACVCVCMCVPDWPQGPEPSRFMRYGKVRAKHLLAQRKALVWDSYWVWAASTHIHTLTYPHTYIEPLSDECILDSRTPTEPFKIHKP